MFNQIFLFSRDVARGECLGEANIEWRTHEPPCGSEGMLPRENFRFLDFGLPS